VKLIYLFRQNPAASCVPISAVLRISIWSDCFEVLCHC